MNRLLHDTIKNLTPAPGPVQRRTEAPSRWLLLGLWMLFVWACPVLAAETVPSIERITLVATPAGIRVQLDAPARFRAVLMDSREVMVAFKGVRLSEKVQKDGNAGGLIRRVKIDRLPNDVVALMVATNQDVAEVETQWAEGTHTLLALFVTEETGKPVPHKARKADYKKPADLASRRSPAGEDRTVAKAPVAPEPKETPAPEPGPPEPKPALAAKPKPGQAMSGTIDDLLVLLDADPCHTQPHIRKALRQGLKKNWRKAFKTLNTTVQSGEETECLEQIYYLRAYAYYKMNRHGDDGLYLEALNYFQDAVSYFPDSSLAPFALASMGKAYKALKNHAEAKGYFKIILEKNKSYAGRPEVMYELGQIYAAEKNLKPCISLYKKFLTVYPDNKLASDVKLGLGKAYYNSSRFADALGMLNDVLEKEPRKAFESEDLLLVTGNCYYQLGKFKEARDALTKAYNFYPEAGANPISLTRIGDTFRDTQQPERASTIYQLVMEKYPGSDGYLISAMRHADLLEKREDKEQVYRMIMTDYPEHPMTNLAVVKLSDLQYKAGEYQHSLETIRPLVVSRPKGLIAEAVYIMQSSLQGLLSELLEADAYPEMVALHQKERAFLRRMDAPDIFRMLGIAYLKGHLYAEAAKLLKKGNQLSGKNGPPDLLFNLGVALQESGDLKEAVEELRRYTQRDPDGEYAGPAHFRLGRILIANGDQQNALKALKKAYRFSKAPGEKANILRVTAEALGELGDWKLATGSLIQAVNLLAESTEPDTGALADTYRQLGESHMRMKSYQRAVDAFTMTLKFLGKERPPGVLLQLGEAHRRAGELEKATEIYSRVAASEDEFWQSLARERLRRINIEEKIRTDGI